jgi:hypothetical protein
LSLTLLPAADMINTRHAADRLLPVKWASTLGGCEYEAGDDQQDGGDPDEPGHLNVPHGMASYTMLKRSVCTRSPGTPSSSTAFCAASIIGSGPQMKNWKRR